MLLHGRHIVDPRTGQPPGDKLATWAAAESAATSDALSTAFMVMSAEEIEQYRDRHADISAMLAVEGPQGYTLRRFGRWD